MIQRSEIKELTARLKEPRKFIQVIVGGDRGEKQQRPHQRRTASLQQQIQAAASLCRRKRGNASGRFPANGLASPISVIQYVKEQFIYHLVIYDVPFGRAGRRARDFYL